jgi:hypothetical protein
MFAGLTLTMACASDPPPPPQPPPPPPAAEAPPPAVEAAPPVAEDTPPPTAEPECQVADDCKKLREPAAGMQWLCENARCLEQAVPEAPKAEATADGAKDDKTSKRAPRGKVTKKK